MDPRLQLYNDIKGVVEAKVPEIVHFGLWNQYSDSVEDDVPFGRPALFIEFGDIEWGQYTKEVGGMQSRGEGTIRLHLLTDWQDDDDYIQPFQIGESLNKAFMEMPSTTRYSVFYPSLTLTNHNHTDIMESVDEYRVRYYRQI